MNTNQMKSMLIVGSFLAMGSLKAQKVSVAQAFSDAQEQTEILLQEIQKDTMAAAKKQVSPRTVEHGKLVMVRSGDWTSGFFPGELWYLYEQSKLAKWKELAEIYTQKIKKEQFNTGTHDLGFMMYCSFGNAYRLTGDTAYRNVIVQSAKSLVKRFNPVAGVIKSWDHNGTKWKYPVIIDNMMNLELLFEVTRLTGDSSFYKIAVSHADQTLKHHFRPDFSSWHVLDYDVKSGKVLQRLTAQGYSDESAWARGQAWALYGFTMCYRETRNPAYLNQARGIANFILKHKARPADGVPYWDYDDPAIPNTSRDASAAAITAAALYELDGYDATRGYRKSADQLLYSLNKNYKAKTGTNKGFLLEHSTGHRPAHSEIDVPINYADYYYLESLLRSQKK